MAPRNAPDADTVRGAEDNQDQRAILPALQTRSLPRRLTINALVRGAWALWNLADRLR